MLKKRKAEQQLVQGAGEHHRLITTQQITPPLLLQFPGSVMSFEAPNSMKETWSNMTELITVCVQCGRLYRIILHQADIVGLS